MKTQVNLKIDDSIKTAAQARAKELGLSLSAVVNATLSQFARTGELHVTSEGEMTPQLAAIIREGQAAYAAGEVSGPFATVDELMEHLEHGS